MEVLLCFVSNLLNSVSSNEIVKNKPLNCYQRYCSERVFNSYEIMCKNNFSMLMHTASGDTLIAASAHSEPLKEDKQLNIPSLAGDKASQRPLLPPEVRTESVRNVEKAPRWM